MRLGKAVEVGLVEVSSVLARRFRCVEVGSGPAG